MKNIKKPVALIRSPLVWSLFLGFVLLLLSSGPAGAVSADEDRLLRFAADDKDNSTVRSLLAQGVSPNAPGDFDGRTAVHNAAKGGAAQNLAAMLQAGGKPNVQDRDGDTPLHLASMGSFSGGFTDHAAAVRVLLKHGANLNRTNSAGETPLHVAVFNGAAAAHADVVSALLDAGAKPSQVDGNGLTALQRFARHNENNGAIVRLLLRAGADPDRLTPGGDTPLHLAIKNGRKGRVVKALLNGGAEPCVQDADGYTPYQLYYAQDEPGIRQALSRAGGGDLACDDASKQTDKGGRGNGEGGSGKSGTNAQASWPPAVASLEQQMVTVQGNTQLGKYEVTQELWTAVMGSNPSKFGGCDECPVEMVSWDDVQVFLKKLNALTGNQYRLPTEAEWAAALGSGGGAWHRENSGMRTHPVGQKSPNELGLYDMKGNVWEWVEDCWEGDCSRRVVRGGSWGGNPRVLRSAVRLGLDTGVRDSYFGFRVARTLTP